MIEAVEHVIVGAGPAGLRAAEVLAEAGREVLVLERNDEIGPKTCAGGLSRKAVVELAALGLPSAISRPSLAHAQFRNAPPTALDPRHAVVRTLSRRALGRWQAGRARTAGAELRTGTAVGRIDLESHTLDAGGRRLRYRQLLGADGSTSVVRRALGVRSLREVFAGEFNVPGADAPDLLVAFDSPALANGYFWVFPHAAYTSFGAGAPRRLVAPGVVRRYLERRLGELGVETGAVPFEGATIEVEHPGFHFTGDVHLAGDAAGMPSALTAEGIYAALITGEEVARTMLEPGAPMPKTQRWLRIKRLHDVVGRIWQHRRPRDWSFAALPALVTHPLTRRGVSAFFLEG